MRLRVITCFMGTAALILGTAGTGAAQTIQDRIDALEGKVEEQGKAIGAALGIDIHALVSTAYTYSANNPDSDFIYPRVETNTHNTFDLFEASLYFSRLREDESFGFAINLDFGTTAETTASDWNGDGALDSSEETNAFEVREAYLVYNTPFELPGGKISLKGGKFVTLLGYEILYNYDSYNYNVSKSILFGYSIPFTHTGLLANFPFSDMISLDLGVVNGWDNVQDSNDSKTLLAGLGISPSDMVSTYLAMTYGAEQPDNGRSKRFTLTGNITVTPTDMVSIVLDGTYGNESELIPNAAGGLDSALWYGGAFYLILNPIERLTVALRTEVFDDADGTRITQANAATGSTTWEISPAVAYQLTDHLLARLEYRHDRSSKDIFDDGAGFKTTSDTVSGQLILGF